MDIIIVDDDKAAAVTLAKKLERYDGTNIKGIALNGNDGLSLIKEHRPDVIFLDIELPDISGIDFLEEVNNSDARQCRVVMYTAHDRFMLRAFRNRAFDYLMKPICDDELRAIIRRLCIDLHSDCSSEAAKPNTQTPATEILDNNGVVTRNDGKFIFYTNAADFRLIDIRDIAVFVYNHDSRGWEIVTSGQEDTIKLKRNVGSDMILSLNEAFVRVSQKHIININYLMEVTGNSCRFFPPFDNIDDVKVGRQFRKKLIDRFSGF